MYVQGFHQSSHLKRYFGLRCQAPKSSQWMPTVCLSDKLKASGNEAPTNRLSSLPGHTVRSVAAAVRKNSAKCKKPATQRRKHSMGTSYCRFLLISVEMLVQYVAFTSTRDMIKSLQVIKKTNYLIKLEASTKVTNQKHQFLIRDNQL